MGDGSAALFHSPDEKQASSHAATINTKEDIRMLQAAQLAHAACEAAALVDAEEVCSVGMDGVVRGMVPSEDETLFRKVACLKLFHRKQQRLQRRCKSDIDQRELTLCIGYDGKAFFWLNLDNKITRLERILHRKWLESRKAVKVSSTTVLSIDNDGIVWELDN